MSPQYNSKEQSLYCIFMSPHTRLIDRLDRLLIASLHHLYTLNSLDHLLEHIVLKSLNQLSINITSIICCKYIFL